MREILQIIREEMVKMGWPELPPAGAVFSGGVSQMNGLIELASMIYESDRVRCAEHDFVGIQNPIYTNAAGLLYFVNRQQYRYSRQERRETTYQSKPGLWQRFKDWMFEIID